MLLSVVVLLLSFVILNCKENSQRDAVHTCNIGGILSYNISEAEINNGICDCCDGSDELPTTSCPNKCEEYVMQQKQLALAYHRNVQAGMRARTELTQHYKSRKDKQESDMAALRKEYKEVDRLLNRMMVLLGKEEAKEGDLRFKLLRERQARCADGADGACDYFYEGWFDEDELMHQGYPLDYANPRVRFHYEYSQKEKATLAKRRGLERVRLSICEAQYLLPDDDARIFTQVGELVNFQNSPGGKVRRKPSPRQRRLNTLFGDFLENGSTGLMRGQLMLLEAVGLLLSPVTLSIRAARYATGKAGEIVWYQATQCATSGRRNDKEMDAESDIEDGAITLRDVCQLILDVDNEGSTVANFISVFNYQRYSALSRYLEVYESMFNLPLWLWEVVYRVPVMYYDFYVLNKQAQLPQRREACLLRSGIDAAMKELDTLEVRMEAQTLLREQSQRKQIIRLAPDGEWNPDRHGGNNVEGPGVDGGPSVEASSKRGGHVGMNKNRQVEHQVIPLDFGSEGLWEAVLGNCVESSNVTTVVPLSDSFDLPNSSSSDTTNATIKLSGNDSYRFCYFDEIKRTTGTTTLQPQLLSLGKFLHWGPLDASENVIAMTAPTGLLAAADTGKLTGDAAMASATTTVMGDLQMDTTNTMSPATNRNAEEQEEEDVQTEKSENLDQVVFDGEEASTHSSTLSATSPSSTAYSAATLWASEYVLKLLEHVSDGLDQLRVSLRRHSRTIRFNGASPGLKKFLQQLSEGSMQLVKAAESMVSYLEVKLDPTLAVASERTFSQHYTTRRGAMPESATCTTSSITSSGSGSGTGSRGYGGMMGGGSSIKRIVTGDSADLDRPSAYQWYYSQQVYVDGSICQYPSSSSSSSSSFDASQEPSVRNSNSNSNSRRRRRIMSLVTFECGMHSAVTNATQVHPCYYEIVMSTPMVCTPYLEEKSLTRLDELGVFGFSQKKEKQG